MPTRRQRQKAYRDWNWDDNTSSPTPPPPSKSSSKSSSKRVPMPHFVRRRRTSVPALIGRAHTMGGKRKRKAPPSPNLVDATIYSGN